MLNQEKTRQEWIKWSLKGKYFDLNDLFKEMYGDQSREFVLISVNIGSCPKRGGGELPYKRNGDARRLALGCKLQLLVSLRVFGIESHYICPFRYRLVLCIKKFTKNALTVTTQKSPLGFSLSLSHTHIGLPKRFISNLLTSMPVTFTSESPPRAVLGCI